MVSRFVFNIDRPTVTVIDKEICDQAYSTYNYRLEYIDKVYRQQPRLRQLIDSAPLYKDRKNTLIDVKLGYYKEGDRTSGLIGWHLDNQCEVDHDNSANRLHIISWGGASTEFIDTLIQVPSYEIYSQRPFARIYLNNNMVPIYKTQEYVWNTFTCEDWHRGGVAIRDTIRFFIRIVESDYIKVQGKKSVSSNIRL